MSRDRKRFRQINILESFAFSKKPRKNSSVPSMEDNLRELMAAAAEKRLELTKTENSEHSPCSDNSRNGHTVAGSSTQASEKLQIPDSEESCLPTSAELFPDSTETLADTPSIEQGTSQETVYSIVEESPHFSSDSAEIFSDEIDNGKNSQEDNDSTDEQVQMSFLNRWPECCIPLPELEPLENHSIMFSTHIRPGVAPRPYPNTYRDKWDPDHVKMPCSNQNRFPIPDSNGEMYVQSRWDLISRSLRRKINSSYDLEKAIMQYNSQYRRWSFRGLHAFFEMCMEERERCQFFEDVLPGMVRMALDLPNICTQPIPLLKRHRDHSITLSQKQIGCLLLNAFFCTFPRRNQSSRHQKDRWKDEYATYPDINFNKLFLGVRNKMPITGEKLKCLFAYFRRITANDPTGAVTFHRQCITEMPDWHESNKGIRTAVIRSDGLIETEGHGMLEVDFANKYVGGGVLGHGCVQEEIRFVICPELIISRLFVESLSKNEVLIITGAEQYSNYSGYSDTFKWEGNFHDQASRDVWGRRQTRIVAMDATNFKYTEEQFKLPLLERELNKAYVGFYEDAPSQNLTAIATGNWGCGAFKGSPDLKFLIQLMAASQAGRDLLYFTFGSKTLKRELKEICELVTEKNLSVGDLWRILLSYSSCVKVSNRKIHPNICDFLHSILSNGNDIEDASTQEITDSDRNAMKKLLDAVQEDSSTEIEDNNSPQNGTRIDRPLCD